VKEEVNDFDELVEKLNNLKSKEEKYSDLISFLQSCVNSDNPEKELNDFLDFTTKTKSPYGYPYGYPKSPYGYPGISVIEELKKILELKDKDKIKTALKDLIEKLTKIKEGYGYPPANLAKSDEKKLAETIDLYDQEICQVGDYGPNGKVTEDMLDKILKNYEALKKIYQPVLTLDHVEAGPAVGVVSALRKQDGKLFADFTNVPVYIAEMIKRKNYFRYSPEIWIAKPEGFPEDTTKDIEPPVLRRVALLGAGVPAMKGLAEAKVLYNNEDFSKVAYIDSKQQEANIEQFNEIIDRVSKLEKDKFREQINNYLENLITEGKILPVQKAKLLPLFEELYSHNATIKFEENNEVKETTTIDLLKNFLSSIKPQVNFEETKTQPKDLVEDEDIKKDRLIENYRKEVLEKTGKKISYTEAMKQLEKLGKI
jgi:hypothetical protein